MEAVMNGGASAPVENISTPPAAPDGAQPEAVKTAAADTAAQNPDEKENKKEHWASKRIKEVSDDRNYWRDLAMRATAAQQTPPQAQQPAADEDDEKGLKDFNYDERAYRRYLDARVEAKAEKKAMEVAARYRTEQEAIGRRAKFDERIEAFAKSVDDFNDVVRWKGDPRGETPVSDGMADYLMDSDEAGPLMYFLGNNSDEALKIARMSPAKAGAALAKLEDRLVAERKKAAEKPVSQAPPPAPRIEASGDAGARIDPTSAESDALSDREWLEKRNKQLQRKRSS